MQLTPSIALVGSGEFGISHRLDCNVYAIEAPDGILLIDSGFGEDTPSIVESTRNHFDGCPDTVMLTHAHADHSQGGQYFKDESTAVVASEKTGQLIGTGTDEELGVVRAKRENVYPDEFTFSRYTPDRTVTAPADIVVAGQEFEVVRVRGHAVDNSCYISEIDGSTVCFVGDAVFSDGSLSLLNMPGSSLADYRSDISRLQGRGIDVLLPGHGVPKLQDGQRSIDEAADALTGISLPPMH